MSILAEYPIPKTAIELYRLLKCREKRNPLDKTTNDEPEGGINAFTEEQMRVYLKAHRDATVSQFVDWIAAQASRWNQPHTSPFCRVGEISEGTLKRVVNIMNGRPQYYGQHLKPNDWDEEIDGKFNPDLHTTAPGTSMLRAGKQFVEAPTGVQTTAAPGTQTEGPGDKPSVGGIVIQAQTPRAPEGDTFAVGPKPMPGVEQTGVPDGTPAGPMGDQARQVPQSPPPPAKEEKMAPYRGPGQRQK